MMVKESKNLKYDKIPKLTDSFEEDNTYEPRDCILESFVRLDDKFELSFRNGTTAVIIARNIQGGREIDIIHEKLNEFIGKSYEEILSINLS